MNPVVKLTDEEKEQQAAIDVEAVRAKMASKGLIEGAPHGTTILDTAAAETRSEGQQPAKKRATRSDKGQPKKPAAPQPGGLLTKEQVSRLWDLMQTKESARLEVETVTDTLKGKLADFRDTSNELAAFIEEITQK